MLNIFRKTLQTTALSLIVFFAASTHVSAAQLSISNTPLFLGTSVQPNVFFLLDDSGSMDWTILARRHWAYQAYDPDEDRDGSFESLPPSGFDYLIEDGNIYSKNRDAKQYIFDDPNAYAADCARTMEGCNSNPSPASLDWRFRTSDMNVTFYNPVVTYNPWTGPCNNDGDMCTDGDFFNALNNAKICGNCSNVTRDLSTDGDTEGGAFKYDIWIDDSGYSGTEPGRGDNFNELGVAAGGVADPNGWVDLWDTHISFSVGASSIEVTRITYAPKSTGIKGLNETSQVLGSISGGACYDILGPKVNVVSIHEQGAAPVITATDGPGCRTIAEVQTNVANWYQYSRRRMYSMKNAITQVMDAQPKFRYGITKFKNPAGLFISVPEANVIDVSTHNFDLKDDLYIDKQEGTGTFLLGGLDTVGKYFKGLNNSQGNPIKHSCQKNFQIVFTDGYYNDGESGYGDVDGDGVSNTGADIAYSFYKSDLNTTIDNNVIPDAGSEKELDPDGDGRTWQHLVTFTVAFGIEGDMSDSDGDGWPDADAKGAAWVGDGSPNKDGDWGDPIACGKANCSAKVDDLWHIAWNTNGTFASARTPEEVVSKLLAAITNIAGRVGSAAAVALNSGTLNANTRVYQAKFNSIDWSGDLESVPVKDGDGDDSNDPPECAGKTIGQVCLTEWKAGEQLESKVYTSRKIFTTNPDTNAVVTFDDLTKLGVTQQLGLKTNPDTTLVESNARGQDRLDWVRGKSAFSYDTGFRERTVGEFGVKKLGDIIASSPAYVAEPTFLYPDTMELDSYSAYKALYKNRTKMVYVGANDGMLHAFDAANGEEVFAYIPSKLVDKLNKLTSPDYKIKHEYYVDGSPVAFDAYNGSWKSLLVTPTGAGSQSVFALDVTKPDTFSTTDVLWEFTDEDDIDMGLSMGDVTYAKMNNNKWAVIIGNGYNNTATDGRPSVTGNGVVYVLDAFTGAIIKKFDTGIGTVDDPLNPGSDRPNGIATVTPIDLNGDLKADYLYAGDLFGNVWKMDVKGSSVASWDFAYKSGPDPKPFYKAVDALGVAQPITAGVSVKLHPTTANQTLVLFGTGKYFEVGDGVTSASSQVQSFYSIWDDNTAAQYARSSLLKQVIVTEEDTDLDGMTDWRITSSDTDVSGDYTINWATDKGWFIDLTNGVEFGEQVIRKPVLRNGRVIFVTTVPDGDPCGYGGSSWIMEMSANTGSRLMESPFDVNGDGIIDETDILSINSKDTIVSGTRSKEGIVATPGILNSPDGPERKYFSGTSGNIDVVLESADQKKMRRQSWRQLK